MADQSVQAIIQTLQAGRLARRGLRPNELGSFTLALSRHALGPGDFRIRLFGQRDGGPEPIGTYGLRLMEN